MKQPVDKGFQALEKLAVKGGLSTRIWYEFLNVQLDAERKEIILHESSLDYMKEHWKKFQPPGFLPQKFFGKGKNGVWKEFLTPERVEKYETICSDRLGLECSNWVKNGGALPLFVKAALEQEVAETLS